jgi:hypothetical protein
MKGLMYTIDTDAPKWKLDSSLIGTNPGLGFRPIAEDVDQGSLIWYESTNKRHVNYWVNRVDKFLESKFKVFPRNISQINNYFKLLQHTQPLTATKRSAILIHCHKKEKSANWIPKILAHVIEITHTVTDHHRLAFSLNLIEFTVGCQNITMTRKTWIKTCQKISKQASLSWM